MVTLLHCDWVALTAFTMLCNHHHDLVAELFITPNGNLMPIRASAPGPLLSPVPDNHQSVCFLCGFACSAYFIWMVCVIQYVSFVSDFFHLAYFQCLSMLCISISTLFYFFSCWIIFHCLDSLHFSVESIGDISIFWLLWIDYSRHLCTSFCLNGCFQFFGVYFVWSNSDPMNNIKPIEKLSESFFWLVFTVWFLLYSYFYILLLIPSHNILFLGVSW